MLLCKFCGKVCKNDNSLRNHERMCKENPNKQESGFKSLVGKPSWNSGLSKETDERVKRQAESVSINLKSLFASGYRTKAQTQEYWTEERRKQRSEWRKQLHLENPETHPNRKVAANRNKMTYPEKVAFDWLQKNHFDFCHQDRIGNKYVDFRVDKIIIEIDGERWHPPGNEKDKSRDEELTEMGYIVHRIRSKENIEGKLKIIFGL